MRTLLTAILLFLTVGSQAQSLYGFNIGPVLNVTNSVDSARSMVRPGLMVEGFYMYQFSPMFYGKVGAGYSLRGYNGSFTGVIPPNDSVGTQLIRQAWLHYVDVPIMIGITSRNAFAEVGGSFSFNVAHQAQDDYYFPDRSTGDIRATNTPDLGLRKFHPALVLNIGYRFVLKDEMTLGLALRTSMLQGLSTNLKGQYFGLSLGLTFGTPLEGTNEAYDFDDEENEPTPDGD